MIPLLGFLPDAPAGTKGAIVDCVNIAPTSTGMEAGPAAIQIGPSVSPETASSAFITKNTQGVSRFFVSTVSGVVFEQTTVGLGSLLANVAIGTDGVAFASFGNVVLASSTAANIVGSTYAAATAPTAPTPFVALAGAPRANILVAAKNFVLAFDTDDALFGVSRDRWWCSAFQDATSWTINPVNQANSGRLVGTPGKITAAAMLGDVCMAYKETGAYMGREAGAPYSWQWDDVDSHFGCVGKRAVCDVDGAHFVVGVEDIWLFDGTRPISIAEGKLKRWLFGPTPLGTGADMSPDYKHKTTCVYERSKSRVWMFYVQGGSLTGDLTQALVYSVKTGKWGRVNTPVQCAFDLENTSGQQPHLNYMDGDFNKVGLFVGSQFHLLVGVSASSSFTVADIGDAYEASYIRSVTVAYNVRPTTAQMLSHTRETLPGASTFRGATFEHKGRFNIRNDGKWHWFQFQMTGNFEATGYRLDNKAAGRK